jgi:predicted MFS family arabinose efflux permease
VSHSGTKDDSAGGVPTESAYSARMRLLGSLGVLREPNFRRLFWGRTISLVGDGISPVAIAFAVLGMGGSATDLGIVIAARSVAVTALVLVGGVFADRISPRLAMLRADLTRVIVMGTMAALLIADAASTWQIALLYGCEGAATAFFNPASNAIIPQVVTPSRLQEATALVNLSRSAGNLVGPAIAGVLLALGTPGWAIAVDALTFALSAAFLLRLRAPRRTDGPAEPSFVSELRHGWTEFASHTWIWVVVLSAAISNAVFFPAFEVLGPTVAQESLGGSSAWAVIAAALGAGSLIGGALALTLRPRRLLLVGESGLVLFGLPVVFLAMTAPVALIAFGAFVAGATVSLAIILYETAAAQHVPQAALSRVMAYDWFGSLALEPVGLVLIGPLAAGIGISPTLWGAAVVLLVCQLAVIAVPSVRRLEARPDGAEPPAPLLPAIDARD